MPSAARKLRCFLRDRLAPFPIEEVDGANRGLQHFLPCGEGSTFREQRRLLDEQRRFADEKGRFTNWKRGSFDRAQ
jgi:hypothetical protein